MSWMRCWLSHLPGAWRHDFSPLSQLEAHGRVLRFQKDKILERRWISHESGRAMGRRRASQCISSLRTRLLKFAFASILARVAVCSGAGKMWMRFRDHFCRAQFFPTTFYIHSHTRTRNYILSKKENKSTRSANFILLPKPCSNATLFRELDFSTTWKIWFEYG